MTRDSYIHASHLDLEQRNELEAIIHDLEDENRLLQFEYDRLCEEHLEKSRLINEQLQYNQINVHDQEILRQAKHLRQYKSKLEQRMKILEEHNQQLEKQLKRSKQLLFKEVKQRERDSFFHLLDEILFSLHRIAHSNDSQVRHRVTSMHRVFLRSLDMFTIDNLFHMADGINRAVGDLVSVITEPQTNPTNTFYQPLST